MEKVSVIVPVYKVEKYIRRCLESLLVQTIDNVEIIVVDDRGGDRSMEIVREIQREYTRGSVIRIVEMPHNSGVSAARNAGLAAASGKYVAFVDGDDWVEPDMYSYLYEEAERLGAEWCYSGAIKDFADGHREMLVQPLVPRGIINGETRKYILTHFVSYFTTSIYRRDFLVKYEVQFPPYRFSEDSFFVWMVVMHARVLGYVEEPFYHYRIHSESVSNTYNADKGHQRMEVFALLLETLKKEGLYEPYQAELDYLVIKKGWLLPLGAEALNKGKGRRQCIRNMVQKGKLLVPGYNSNIYLKRDRLVKLLLLLFIHCPSLASALFRCYIRHNRKMVV